MGSLRVAGCLFVLAMSGLASAQTPPPNPPGAKAAPPAHPPGNPAAASTPGAPPPPRPASGPSKSLVVADAADVTAFETALADVERLLGARKWTPAHEALDTLLAQHVDHEEVLLHASEVSEDLQRASFGEAYTPPDVKSLISGELQSYDPRSGKIKLHYKRDTKAVAAPADDEDEMSEFERVLRELLGMNNAVGQGDFTWAGGAPMHPIHFSGPYTVEISGFFPEADGDGMSVFFMSPYIVLSMGEGEWYQLNFGYPRTIRGTTTYTFPASITHSLGGKSVVVDKEDDSPIKPDKPYTLKVVVTDDKITASYNGKTFLSAARDAGSYGQFGFRSCPEVKELSISGQANTAWLEGLKDADQHEAWTKFAEAQEEHSLLPDWLAARLVDEPPSFDQALEIYPGATNPAHASHLITLRAMEKEGEYDKAVAYLRDLPAGKCTEEFRQVLLGLFCERADDSEGALAACDKVLELAPGFVPAHVQRARLLHGEGRVADAHAELQGLLDKGCLDGALHAEHAREVLFDQGPGAAREALRASLRQGVAPGQLAALDAVLLRAERGPAWDRPFEFKSRNYLVRSDHSQKLCADAAQALEQAFALYGRVLGRPPAEGEVVRYPVFLFSGLSGYLDYSEVLYGSAPVNTAGSYTPVLKQLLIWNLPDRDDMLRTVRHEGFHQYLDRVIDRPPTWFNEGTAEYFEAARTVNGQLEAGAPSRLHVLELTGKDVEWVPVDQLVRMGAAEFYKDASIHYAEAWALVHLLLQGGREDKALYDAYFAGLLAKRAPRALADELFPASGAQALQSRLKAHVKELRKAIDDETLEKKN